MADTLPQFIRYCNLIVSNNIGRGIDLSQFRIRFQVNAGDFDVPNSATIRVYNLDPVTINRIKPKGEFQNVTLSAGYVDGAQGVIFQGTMTQFKIGRESATDTYMDIMATDGDLVFISDFFSTSIASGWKPRDVLNIATASGDVTINTTYISDFDLNLPAASRGKVLYGNMRDMIHNAAEHMRCTWSVQNGVVVVKPYNAYNPNNIVNLSETTGVIGMPEQTDEGIKIKILINPNIVIGTTVNLNNAIINQSILTNWIVGGSSMPQQSLIGGVPFNSRGGLQYIAGLSSNGHYRVYAIDHEGDTRGEPWYSTLTCLQADVTTKTTILNPSQGN